MKKDKTYYEQEASYEEYLDFYKKQDLPTYEKPSLTVDGVVYGLNSDGKLSVVLIKRKSHPFRGCFALPGGFVEPNEPVGDAIIRELEEETDLKILPEQVEQLATFSGAHRDPRTWVVSVAHLIFLRRSQLKQLKAGDDAAEVFLGEVDFKTGSILVDGVPVPDEQFAFDHREILNTSISRIIGHVDWNPNFLEVLGDDYCEFSIKEAVSVINQVERGLDKSPIRTNNFLDKYKDFVQEVGTRKIPTSYKPVKIYKMLSR